MGSDSDWPTMEAAVKVCGEFDVPCDVQVCRLTARRTTWPATPSPLIGVACA